MSSKIVASKKTFENSIKRDIFPKLRIVRDWLSISRKNVKPINRQNVKLTVKLSNEIKRKNAHVEISLHVSKYIFAIWASTCVKLVKAIDEGSTIFFFLQVRRFSVYVTVSFPVQF